MADPVVDAFAGMKKKKKKVVALDLDETPAPAAPAAEASATGTSTPEPAAEDKPAEDAGDMFADLKKKKKKKKDIPLDLEGGDSPAADAADVPIVKKKKKKPAADFAAEVGGNGAGDGRTVACAPLVTCPSQPPALISSAAVRTDTSSTSLTPRRLPTRTPSTSPHLRTVVSTLGLPRTVTLPTPSC